MASIYERSGRLYAQFYDGDRSPPRKQFSLRTSDDTEARQRLTDFERAYENGDFDPWTDDPFSDDSDEGEGEEGGAPATLEEAIAAFCRTKERQGRAESTIRKYREIWDLFARHVESEELDELEHVAVSKFVHDPTVQDNTGLPLPPRRCRPPMVRLRKRDRPR